MKLFVFIVCVSMAALVSGLTEEQKQKLRTIHQECQSSADTRIDDQALESTLKSKGDPSNVQNIGPHSLCMNRKLGLQKENGDVDTEGLRSRLSHVVTDEAKLNQLVNNCSTQKATPEATAINLLRCFHELYGNAGHHHH